MLQLLKTPSQDKALLQDTLLIQWHLDCTNFYYTSSLIKQIFQISLTSVTHSEHNLYKTNFLQSWPRYYEFYITKGELRTCPDMKPDNFCSHHPCQRYVYSHTLTVYYSKTVLWCLLTQYKLILKNPETTKISKSCIFLLLSWFHNILQTGID